ncbi:hypothetical protein [Microvirga zambiensis]|uniref:hypothetical protein n=1 Tax=Microvirga zambiensis TaxID=1402137 RepID=UPI00191F72E8|nr:hypothetical protein [Microvirga zambiensis]
MSAMEALYLVFVSLSGLAMGSLAVLMLGHLMAEHWLAPVRAELEAAALTLPVLILIGIPLAFGLDQLFPWMSQRADLPPLRAAFLSPGFYLVRSAFYLLACAGLAFWLVRNRQVRRASAIGLALMTPIMSFAAYDWVLSRDPHWWSTLFGFAYGLNQTLAALACAILVTLLGAEHASPTRMKSLERALLTLALLTVWTWFSQFLIVWLANLPAGAGWYLERSDQQNLRLLTVSHLLMLIAIVVLVPSGVSRLGMIVGSALALLYHGTHMLWILQPKGHPSWPALAVILGATALWIAAYAFVMRTRPTYAEEALAEPE